MQTRVTELLGVEYPIIQAPMGYIARAQLASAVSNGVKPLYVAWDPASGDVEALKRRLAAGLEQYRRDYAAYYEACRHPNSPAMRPTVARR